MPHRRTASHVGFTVVELAAVVSAAAVGVALLQPVLTSRAHQARTTTAFQQHGILGQAQLMYTGEHQGWYAGINTSGAYFQAREPGGIVRSNELLFDTTPSTPTSTWDWISPIAGDAMGFSPNRAERLHDVLTVFGDPRANRPLDALFGPAQDMQDFIDVYESGGFRQVSFLQTRSFHYYPSGIPFFDRPRPTPDAQNFLRAGSDGLTNRPVDFAPRLDRVGTVLAEKVMHADGTRYYTPPSRLLDIEITTNASIFGNFMDHTPIVHSSTAYGRLHAEDQGNVELSFRQRGGGMITTRFDGSVQVISRDTAWRRIPLWYPSGTVFTGGDHATPESLEFAENLPDAPGGGKLIP